MATKHKHAAPARDGAPEPLDEKQWWTQKDPVEPFMGVPAVTGGLMPAPVPDDRPSEPEPGVEEEQEDGEHLPVFETPEWERLES